MQSSSNDLKQFFNASSVDSSESLKSDFFEVLPDSCSLNANSSDNLLIAEVQSASDALKRLINTHGIDGLRSLSSSNFEILINTYSPGTKTFNSILVALFNAGVVDAIIQPQKQLRQQRIITLKQQLQSEHSNIDSALSVWELNLKPHQKSGVVLFTTLKWGMLLTGVTVGLGVLAAWMFTTHLQYQQKISKLSSEVAEANRKSESVEQTKKELEHTQKSLDETKGKISELEQINKSILESQNNQQTEPETYTSELSMESAQEIVDAWLFQKSSLFAQPFDLEIAQRLTTGQLYYDLIKPDGSVNWLRTNASYYTYQDSRLIKVLSFNPNLPHPQLTVQVYEDRTLHGPNGIDKNESGISTKTITYIFARDGSDWKIFDYKTQSE